MHRNLYPTGLRIAALALCGVLIQGSPVRAAEGAPLIIAAEGKTDYRIVIATNATACTRYAAAELSRFVEQMTGARLDVVGADQPGTEHEILLGDSARVKALAIPVDGAALGEEGYLLGTAGRRLVIAGGGPRGILYGVYGLLDEHWGCRWFTPSISRIPKVKRLELAALDQVRRPALEYREVMLFDCWDTDWYVRNRLNTTRMLHEEHGGSVQFVPGYYVHTFKNFLPVEEYYADHPEYFCEVDGQRLRENNQLCTSNEDVVRLVTEKVRVLLRQHPECKVISVSQNDANKNYCRCARCAELDEREGSHAGQIFALVNRVAEAVEKEFPDRAIETLAYEWSRRPPKTLKPRDNVIVRLSTIRCSFSEPLGTSELPVNRGFRRDLKGWAQICRRIWIWDYMTYFSYYLLPFPNYRVLDDNLRFFCANNVRGVVEQDNWQSPNGELAGLAGYLAARFLWDAEYSEEVATREFLEGVYGAAAPHIQAYMDLLSDKVQQEKINLSIYGSRTPPYLTLDILQAADKLWEQAEAAVAGEPDVLRRVRIARLSLDYAYIEHYRWKPEGMVTYDGNPRRGKVSAIDPGYAARVRRFLDVSKGAGITHMREGHSDYEEYVKWLESLFPPK